MTSKSKSMLSDPQLKRTSSCSRYLRILEERIFPLFPATLVEGKALTVSWLQEHDGMSRPILVDGNKDTIRLSAPDAKKVSDIVSLIGSDHPVKLIEVGMQSELVGYTIGDFAKYLNERTSRHKVLNLISLEISKTPLNSKVASPRLVRSIDWIDIAWPIARRSRADYPQVQKYCLTGMAQSYTDFHIDFGGTSVWYHVLQGRKRFFFVAPTICNLKEYEKWTCSPDQDNSFFGDLVPNQCFYIDLMAGQTLIIPSGWIHAVYTPEDSLVFGGNFLHSYSVIRQLQVHTIEERTHVKQNYRFPYFRQINFYAVCLTLSKCRTLTGGAYDRDRLSTLKASDIFESQTIFKQFAFLVKVCLLLFYNYL